MFFLHGVSQVDFFFFFLSLLGHLETLKTSLKCCHLDFVTTEAERLVKVGHSDSLHFNSLFSMSFTALMTTRRGTIHSHAKS